jgi:hypothetical protein
MPRQLGPTEINLPGFSARQQLARAPQARDQPDLSTLRQKAIAWGKAKSAFHADEAIRADQRDRPEESDKHLAKSWEYHAFTRCLERNQHVDSGPWQSSPESAQFKPLLAEAIRNRAVVPMDDFQDDEHVEGD